MTDKPSNKLTLPKAREGLVEESENGPLILGIYDFNLPCRRFTVEHKISEVGKISVTAEFLLRLVRAVEHCSEEDAQAFFGYTRREMAYVLSEVEEADYVRRTNGWINLTATGFSLFQPGSNEPLIYKVERETLRVGFDLISLAPAERRILSRFEMSLPELPLADVDQVSSAAVHVPASFRRFFRELVPRAETIMAARRTLYSIDSVTAEDRFSTLARVRLVSSGLRPSQADIDLSDWRTEYELEDREAVIRVINDFVKEQTITQRVDDKTAYQLLTDLAAEYLSEWTRRDGLNVDRFYRHAFTSHGDIRTDRQTAPIVGSLFTPENTRRLFEVASYGLRWSRPAKTAIFWIVPRVPLWGSTAILKDILDQLRDNILGKKDDVATDKSVRTVALTAGRPERWVKAAFDECYQSDASVVPRGFEMLLVPGAFVAATVHAPIGQQRGLAVPLGFVSFDEKIVSRAKTFLGSNAYRYKLPEELEKQLAISRTLQSS